jgi:hypothetical protein
MDDEAKKWLWYSIPVVVVIGLAAALYYGRKSNEPIEQPPAKAVTQAVVDEPAIRNPIESEPTVAPLPALDESDGAAKDALTGTFGRQLEQVLVPKSIVRNVVATIDNLPRKKVPALRLPLKPTGGELATSGADELTLSPENYARYDAVVKLVQNSDTAEVAKLYRRFYPLLQQAYTDLGYPDGYFNDRLVEVIDHLLQTPDVRGPIELRQPSVVYEFADPALEERSSGQKLLLRMGPDNAATVKAKLKELRREVTKGAAGNR